MTHKDTLQQILNEIRAEQSEDRTSLCVFDIDSTILDVSPRIMRIIEDFQKDKNMRQLYPLQCDHLTQAQVVKGDWGIKDIAKRLDPACEEDGFLAELESYWSKHFFSNDYLKFDTPYPGSVEFVQEVFQAGAQIVYLTGRDQHRMAEGSRESLLSLGFPLDDQQAQLVLKPHRKMDDAEFKRDWFTELERAHLSSIWFFENEPVNIELVRAEHEDVRIIFFDSTHSGRAPAPEDLPRVHHFLWD